MVEVPDGYKKVWNTVNFDTRPEFIPEDKTPDLGRVEVEPPEDVILTRFDHSKKEWEYRERELKEDTSDTIKTLVQSADLTDEQAIALAQFFDEWLPGMKYAAGKIIRYMDELYRVIQDHTSQEDWLPADEAALYDHITIGEGGYEAWEKPTGGHNSYDFGARVTHNNKLWESQITGNDTEPGADENDRWWKEIVA